jgi:hypothetical protein
MDARGFPSRYGRLRKALRNEPCSSSNPQDKPRNCPQVDSFGLRPAL